MKRAYTIEQLDRVREIRITEGIICNELSVRFISPAEGTDMMFADTMAVREFRGSFEKFVYSINEEIKNIMNNLELITKVGHRADAYINNYEVLKANLAETAERLNVIVSVVRASENLIEEIEKEELQESLEALKPTIPGAPPKKEVIKKINKKGNKRK